MSKKLLILLSSFLLIFSFANIVFAKTVTTTKVTTLKVTVKPTPTATPVPNVDSFSLFWPMVAGKTVQSKVYFLKIWEEKIRGILIFGSAQKADYDIFLGIKRTLEAEALIKGNAVDAANSTLDNANNELGKANDALTNAKNSGDVDQTTKDEINTRKNNLIKFVSYLMFKYPNYKDKLQGLLDKLNSLTL